MKSLSIIKRLLFFAYLFLPMGLIAQVEFRGKVLDSSSQSGVSHASVFLIGSTIGISTDDNGFFSLLIPDGNYEVMVRLVGYTPKLFSLSTLDINPDGYKIFLNPSYQELDFLEVEEQRDPIWYENLSLFKQYFLGKTKNGKETSILNQNILRLDSESVPLTLQVNAHDVLQIENPNLGYRVEYLLEEFTYSTEKGTFFYSGFSRFIPDSTLKRSKGKRIESNRKQAYLGSMQHLIGSLYDGTAEDEGFEFRSIERLKNPERPEQSLIDEAKIRYAQSSNREEKDSLKRNFLRKERISPFVNEVKENSVPSGNLVRIDFDRDGRKFLNFEDLLHVTYTKEMETDEYLNQFRPKKPGWQQSILRLGSREIEIFHNGTYGDRSGIFLEGYLGWEKIGDLMPLDYSYKRQY